MRGREGRGWGRPAGRRRRGRPAERAGARPEVAEIRPEVTRGRPEVTRGRPAVAGGRRQVAGPPRSVTEAARKVIFRDNAPDFRRGFPVSAPFLSDPGMKHAESANPRRKGTLSSVNAVRNNMR